MPIKIAIIGERIDFRSRLRLTIARDERLACVCVCDDVETAIRCVPPVLPDVIVIGVGLRDQAGAACLELLHRAAPAAQILVFTACDETGHIVRALQAGASGCLTEDSDPKTILAAIHELQNRGAPLSPQIARKLVESFRRAGRESPEDPLTPREREILALLGEGLLYKEIADRLGITLDTVGTHTKSIYRKLRVRSRTEAVMQARPGEYSW